MRRAFADFLQFPHRLRRALQWHLFRVAARIDRDVLLLANGMHGQVTVHDQVLRGARVDNCHNVTFDGCHFADRVAPMLHLRQGGRDA